MKYHHLVVLPSGQRSLVREGISILEAIRNCGYYVTSDCGGQGTCGKCRVMLFPERMPTTQDRLHLNEDEIEQGVRLACQHIVHSDTRVVLLDVLKTATILDESNVSKVSVPVDQGREGEYGIAIDVGTTTVVAYLLDLETGDQLGVTSVLNPQVAYGDDVISRLVYSEKDAKNAVMLQKIIVDTIESLCLNLLKEFSLTPDVLTLLCFVGNTVMHHFVLGLDISKLSRAPYVPSRTEGLTLHTDELRFSTIKGEAYAAPLIGGFIGSDTVALILSQGLHQTKNTYLAIDIGTNGEIVLSHDGHVYACSTAAGSAFEGASVTHGMRGQVGAIEHVTFDAEMRTPELSISGDVIPRGLCGSAIVDVVAEMLYHRVLTPEGRILDSPRTIEGGSFGRAFIVVEEGEYSAKKRILFTQKDVRQIQLAKAAIRAGAEVLLAETGVPLEMVDAIILAGAFGNYIDPSAALSIGLLPPVSKENIKQVGNTAGLGAKMMLVSSDMRKEAEMVAKSTHYISLAGRKAFEKRFIGFTIFPTHKSDLYSSS